MVFVIGMVFNFSSFPYFFCFHSDKVGYVSAFSCRLNICIISAWLSISIVNRAITLRNIRLDHVCLSLCQSVSPQSVLWQNGWLDPDAVWDGEWNHPRHLRIRLGSRAPRARGCFGDFSAFAPPLVWMGRMTYFCTEMYSTCTWEKLTVFPYGQDIIGIYVSLAFWRYSKVRGWCWVLCKICKNVTLISGRDRPIRPYSSNACKVSRNKVSRLKVSRVNYVTK